MKSSSTNYEQTNLKPYGVQVNQIPTDMEQKFYNVMVDCNGYPELENGGEELTLDEAHEFIKRMEEYFPDNLYTIVPFVFIEKNHEDEDRMFSRWTADGWEDFYNTDEG